MSGLYKIRIKMFRAFSLVLIWLILVRVRNWQKTSILQALKPHHTSLTDYTFINYINNAQQFILIFGGMTASGQLTKDLFRINLNDNTLKKLTFIIGPSQRKGMCSTYFNKKMYIYGGTTKNGSLSSQLWEFDILNNQWTNHGAYINGLSSCFITQHNGQFYIMGSDSTNAAVIFSYQYGTHLWQSRTYTYYGIIKFETKLWDSNRVTATLDISSKDQISSVSISLVKSTSLPMNAVCSGKSSTSSIFIYFATSKAIYRLNLETLQINWLSNINEQIKSNDTFKCISSNAWFFFVSTDSRFSTRSVRISYYKINDFSVHGVNDRLTSGDIDQHNRLLKDNNIIISKLRWPIEISQFQIFLDSQQNLNLLSNSDLRSYVLSKECSFTKNAFVKSCFYGKTMCQDGYIGFECTNLIANCPSTLVLYDQSSYSSLQSQCSGNGVCTQSGCICSKYFSGNDCSIYTRKKCDGNLIYNYPVMNCECKSETVGGNNCEVQYCYNDCTENGVCQINGQCTCNQQYQGSDCSVFIISFPN